MRTLKNIISVSYTLIRFGIIYAYKYKNFKFHLIERFSPNTQISFINGGTIHLGKAVRAHSNVKLRVVKTGYLKIGDNASFNYGCMITSMKNIVIGKGVEFGPNVLVYDHDHDFRTTGGLKKGKYKCRDVTIGDNTWVGANTIILSGTEIGRNCVIGAGAVVKGKFPDNSLVIQRVNLDVKPILQNE